MPQRTALLISTILTVLTLLGGIGLAVRVGTTKADVDAVDEPTATALPAAADPDPDVQRELLDRLGEFNAALATSYQRIAALVETVDRLQAQNALLREREAVYEARLAEANQRLAAAGQAAISTPADANVAQAAPPAAPPTVESLPAPMIAVVPRRSSDDEDGDKHERRERSQGQRKRNNRDLD